MSTTGYDYGPPVLVAPPGGAPLNAVGEVEDGGRGGAPVVVSPPAVTQKPGGGSDLTFQTRYLNPDLGTVSTPDPGPLPTTFTVVARVVGPGTGGSGSAACDLAGQWSAEPNVSWNLQRYAEGTGAPAMIFSGSTTGTYAGNVQTNVPIPEPPGGGTIEWVATSINLNDAGGWHASGWASPDGTNWSGVATPISSPGLPATLHDTPNPLYIGGIWATNYFQWRGRIYWVELRTGLNPTMGSVVWRFDAADRTGTGTTYTDPRGRTWTLQNANAIVTE